MISNPRPRYVRSRRKIASCHLYFAADCPLTPKSYILFLGEFFCIRKVTKLVCCRRYISGVCDKLVVMQQIQAPTHSSTEKRGADSGFGRTSVTVETHDRTSLASRVLANVWTMKQVGAQFSSLAGMAHSWWLNSCASISPRFVGDLAFLTRCCDNQHSFENEIELRATLIAANPSRQASICPLAQWEAPILSFPIFFELLLIPKACGSLSSPFEETGVLRET